MTETPLDNYLNPIAAAAPDSSIHATLILACYKVAQYLPKFLASLDAQTVEHSSFELVFVIDGCPEGSESIVKTWAETSDYSVRVVSKPNGGVASARNLGLVWARGQWVSSPDPDDVLESTYLREISDAQAQHPESNMTVGRICLRGAKGNLLVHPLDNKFVDESEREVDLQLTPDHIQTLGGVVFFRLQRIRELGLQHNASLPTASDADFIMNYLLRNGEKYVLVPSAHYIYQRRADDSSIVKMQERNIDRFRTVFGVTHRSLLEQVAHECPQWLANTLLYFTYYLFRRNLHADSPVYETDKGVLEEIDEALRENLRRIGADRVARFRLFDVPVEMRMAWLAIASGGASSSPVEVLRHKQGRGLWQICFYSANATEASEVFPVSNGSSIVEKKIRGVEFLGRVWTYQYILIVDGSENESPSLSSSHGVGWELGGRAFTAREIRNLLGQQRVQLPAITPVGPKPTARVESARTRIRRTLYAVSLRALRLSGRDGSMKNAVVFDLESDDAYRSVHQLSQGIKARLEISSDVKEWVIVERRPKPIGSQKNVVRRGSLLHFVLMKHAAVLVSDRLPKEAQPPFPGNVLSADWTFVFASAKTPGSRSYRTLNGTEIDFLVAESAQERDTYVRDGGNFRFMPSQVLLAPGYRSDNRK